MTAGLVKDKENVLGEEAYEMGPDGLRGCRWEEGS